MYVITNNIVYDILNLIHPNARNKHFVQHLKRGQCNNTRLKNYVPSYNQQQHNSQNIHIPGLYIRLFVTKTE